MAVTIKDVAKEAGVAIATVSRYINGAAVKPENRENIEAAIKKLDFSPNRSARGLKSQRTYMVGVLADQIDNAYIKTLLVHFEKYLNQKGYAMILCYNDNLAESAREYVEFLVEQMVDGIFICCFPTDEDFLQPAREAGIPVVSLEDRFGSGEMDIVRVDSTTSTYELIESLVRNGHRRIAIINGPEAKESARERQRGYLRVFEDYEIPVYKSLVIFGEYDEETGYREMKKLMEQENLPTAVFAANYNICIGALRAIHEMKIRIPEDLSLVTFDDHLLSLLTNPKLTAVRQPLEAIGAQACRLLMERIEQEEPLEPQMVRLKAEVIYRDSVGVPRENENIE